MDWKPNFTPDGVVLHVKGGVVAGDGRQKKVLMVVGGEQRSQSLGVKEDADQVLCAIARNHEPLTVGGKSQSVLHILIGMNRLT